jgi:HEAT repeat protein
MTAEQIDSLFAKTLTGDYDGDDPWTAVHELRRIGSRDVFERAAAWCNSNIPLVRARGLDVLAQIGKRAGHPQHAFPAESYSIISDLLQREHETRPLMSAIYALGHIENPEAVPLVTAYQSHPDPDIRNAVVFALASFPNDPRSIESLLMLLRDNDDDVRDWATFGLGVLGDADSIEIRDALLRQLSDPNQDVREEAMAALAKRQDKRVVASLVEALKQPEVTMRVIEAACAMLGMDRDYPSWSSGDYIGALRKRFADAK